MTSTKFFIKETHIDDLELVNIKILLSITQYYYDHLNKKILYDVLDRLKKAKKKLDVIKKKFLIISYHENLEKKLLGILEECFLTIPYIKKEPYDTYDILNTLIENKKKKINNIIKNSYKTYQLMINSKKNFDKIYNEMINYEDEKKEIKNVLIKLKEYIEIFNHLKELNNEIKIDKPFYVDNNKYVWKKSHCIYLKYNKKPVEFTLQHEVNLLNGTINYCNVRKYSLDGYKNLLSPKGKKIVQINDVGLFIWALVDEDENIDENIDSD